jgi:heme/copper-type cytochrome/quinol oxidase subunit 2
MEHKKYIEQNKLLTIIVVFLLSLIILILATITYVLFSIGDSLEQLNTQQITQQVVY